MTDEATKLPLESANIVNENITKLGQPRCLFRSATPLLVL